jgi:hypothetical protein
MNNQGTLGKHSKNTFVVGDVGGNLVGVFSVNCPKEVLHGL